MVDSEEIMFAEERKKQIIELVVKNEKVTVPYLSKFFNVSSATIRNDLRELENGGLLKRTHGGAMSTSKSSFEVEPKDKEIKNIDEKKAIAEEALKLIENGDTIMLDTGTTTFQLANLLSKRENLTIVTNDILIANKLEEFDSNNVILIGGMLRKKYHCVVGNLGVNMISNLVIDKAFMAANGLSTLRGASTPDINQSEIKKSMISISDKVIFLCDSTKIGKNSFINFAQIDQIDTIITDSKINDKIKEKFETQGVEVISV